MRKPPTGGFFIQTTHMLAKGNVFLIGPMGSGKTAVGRHLARMLRFTFHDSDADIEARTGVDIARKRANPASGSVKRNPSTA
jgi:stage III sporulation protein SpoIIIAA